MNAVLQKSNYNTIELRRPSVCSVCCNIFEDYDTPYMNTEGISQIQANKKAYLKKTVIFCPLGTICRTDGCVSIALPRLYHFANSLCPSIFWLFPCSRRFPFKEIVAVWDSLLFHIFSVALYEEPTSKDYGKASRNVACDSPETMTKMRFSPTVSCTNGTIQVNANVHAYS